MAAEIRAILVGNVTEPNESPGMLVTLLDRLSDQGGVDLEIPARRTPQRAADLSA
jgi:hypothetical protein